MHTKALLSARLVFPAPACELQAPNYSQGKWSQRLVRCPQSAAAQHEQQRDTSARMKTQQETQHNTIRTLELHIPALSQANRGWTHGAAHWELWASWRKSHDRARRHCQIQQLSSAHDDADGGGGVWASPANTDAVWPTSPSLVLFSWRVTDRTQGQMLVKLNVFHLMDSIL